MCVYLFGYFVCFFKQKTAYEMRIGDWSSDVCSSDLGNSVFTVAIERVEKGLQYAYRDRRTKKRNFRALWIQRINAGAREHGLTYSQFMNGIRRAGIELDRKVLSDLAVREPDAFKSLVEQAKAAQA